jgi:hypothetical protein
MSYTTDQLLFFAFSLGFWVLVIIWALRRIFRDDRDR